jgi:oligopeptide transport system substrate-binding protein
MVSRSRWSVSASRLIHLVGVLTWLLLGVSALATPSKTLRIALAQAETSLDPIVVSDLYSNTIIQAVLEPMLAYDYLARPAKLIPNTLEGMPEVSDAGATYTFRVKRGVYFTPDTAFGGRPRELTAADYLYSIKRLFDPKLKSPWLFLLEGKIEGLDNAMQAAKSRPQGFDYDADIAGLQLLDRYTLRIRLKEPDYNLLYILATPTLSALAREVVERYGEEIGVHPVGTGPYYVVEKEWVRSHRLVLQANPGFRGTQVIAPEKPEAGDQAVVDAMRGKRLPVVERVEITVIEEAQPRYLAFLNGELDYSAVPAEFVNLAVPGGKLAKNLAKRGIQLHQFVEQDVTYTYFNMEDPVVGGYGKEKVALRRAISMAYDREQEIRIIRQNQAIAAQSPLPPGVAGYDAAFRTTVGDFDPARAKALLDLFGYSDRDGDGYRELPDGKPLTLEYASTNGLLDRQFDELWKKCLDRVGLRIKFKKGKWPDLLKESKLGKLQMKGSAWSADYPDGDNFLQLLYGGNAGQANDARFRLPEFDRLYERAKHMPDSPERTRLFQQMTKLVLVYAPWKLGTHRVANVLVQPWVVGFKPHPLIIAPWMYLDVGERHR